MSIAFWEVVGPSGSRATVEDEHALPAGSDSGWRSSSYDAGLTRHLNSNRVTVIEVDRPDRKSRRMQGKSDPLDAGRGGRGPKAPTPSWSPSVACRPVVPRSTPALRLQSEVGRCLTTGARHCGSRPAGSAARR